MNKNNLKVLKIIIYNKKSFFCHKYKKIVVRRSKYLFLMVFNNSISIAIAHKPLTSRNQR